MAGIEWWLGSRYVTIKVIWLERLAGCSPGSGYVRVLEYDDSDGKMGNSDVGNK
jgi:hypothetical protein